MESKGHLHKRSLQNCSNKKARELLWGLHLHPKSESAVSINLKKIHVSQVAISKALIQGKAKSEPKREKQKGKRDIQGFKKMS